MSRDRILADVLTVIIAAPALLLAGFVYVALAWNVLNLIEKVYP